MKKTLITLSILALIASSCGNKTTQQMETPVENNVESTSILQYGGIYTFGDENSETANGKIYIYPETDSTALFYLFKMRGAPSYNMGSIDGQIVIQDGKAIFRKGYTDLENDCVLRFEFRNDTLIVAEDENDCDCSPEFGYGVHINNTFLQISSETPQYYTNITNEKVYFSQWKDEKSSELSDIEIDYDESNDFVMPSDWEGVTCKKYNEDDGYTTIQECTFPNAKLQQVYDIIKTKMSDMQTELPENNIEYEVEERMALVTYTYKEPKHLNIRLFYEGGEIVVDIIEKEGETHSKIMYLHD